MEDPSKSTRGTSDSILESYVRLRYPPVEDLSFDCIMLDFSSLSSARRVSERPEVEFEIAMAVRNVGGLEEEERA